MADFIDLCLDKFNVESTTSSIVREYLARKGFKETLSKLDEECPRNEKSLNSRTKILDYLKIDKLYEINKKLKEPYSSVLEILVSYLVVNKVIDNNNKNNNNNINNNNRMANDMNVEEAEDGELSEGSEKRFRKEKQKEESIKRQLVNKTTTTSSKDKVTKRDESTTSKRSNNEQEQEYKKENKQSASLSNNKNSNSNSDLTKDQQKLFSNLRLDDDNSNNKESIGTSTGDNDDFDLLLKEKAKKIQAKNNIPTLPTESQPTATVLSKPQSNSIKTTSVPAATPLKQPSGAAGLSSVGSNLNNQLKNDKYTVTPMDYQSATALKNLIFGAPNISFNDEWRYQSFTFCDYVHLKYGIVQKKGGPCGVLASIQAYLLIELLFRNEESCTPASFDVNKRDRSKYLATAISKLLWKCGSENNEAILCVPTNKGHFAPVGKYRSDGITETLNLLHFDKYENLEEYLKNNVYLFETEDNPACVLLLYSAIFSRTIKGVQSDMDEPTNKLMGQHFYCTQDMVNLLIHGKAYSNVFNDVVYCDELKLRGPDKRNDIGLLSLFEHYKSCEVGSYYKTPKYPVWVVCSESHFSVLFSLKKEILNDWKAEKKFDLYYYDGLSRQDEQIKLTIDGPGFGFFNSKAASRKKGDLIPPLELVIQTKWNEAVIDWNGYEPIL